MNQGCSKTVYSLYILYPLPKDSGMSWPQLRYRCLASSYVRRQNSTQRSTLPRFTTDINLGTVCKLINHLKWCTKSETQGKCHHQNAAVQGSCTQPLVDRLSRLRMAKEIIGCWALGTSVGAIVALVRNLLNRVHWPMQVLRPLQVEETCYRQNQYLEEYLVAQSSCHWNPSINKNSWRQHQYPDHYPCSHHLVQVARRLENDVLKQGKAGGELLRSIATVRRGADHC